MHRIQSIHIIKVDLDGGEISKLRRGLATYIHD